MEAAFIDEFIKTLQDRFAKNMRRQAKIDWKSVQVKLEANPKKLKALVNCFRRAAAISGKPSKLEVRSCQIKIGILPTRS